MEKVGYRKFTCRVVALFIAVVTTLIALPLEAQELQLFVSDTLGNTVLRYNGQTGAFISPPFVPPGNGGLQSPTGLVFFGPDCDATDGTVNCDLYVSSYDGSQGTGSILRYNGQTGAFVSTLVPPGSGDLQSPTDLVLGPDCDAMDDIGNCLYVSDESIDAILSSNGQSGDSPDFFVLPGSGGLNGPAGLVFGPNCPVNCDLYVSSQFTNSVLRYDGQTGAFVSTLVPPGSGGLQSPTDLVFGPNCPVNCDLYVSSYDGSQGTGSILRYDGQTGAFISPPFVPPGNGGLQSPTGLVFGPDCDATDGTFNCDLYVSSYDGSQDTGSVLRYDGQTGAFVSTLVPPGSGGLQSPTDLVFLVVPQR